MILHIQKVAGISGSEAHLLSLLPELRQRGWDVRMLMLHEDEPGAWDFARALEARWASRQGWVITVPETEPAENLRLVDVRRCLSTDGRVAHLMYLWHGEPLSVYVLPKVLGRDRVLDSMGHQTAIWSANGRTYAVLANGHPQDFDTIVEYVKTHAR